MKFSDVERIFCSYDQGYYWSQQKISTTSPRRSTIFVGWFGGRTNAFWSAVRMGRISISILQRNTFSFTQFRHPKSVGDISRNTVVVVKRCSAAKDTSRGQYYFEWSNNNRRMREGFLNSFAPRLCSISSLRAVLIDVLYFTVVKCIE